MAGKLYGSLHNRLEENRMYIDEIKVGTGVTEYHWSDRSPYEVIEVRDQKHVIVRELDHIHIGGGVMDNSWKLVSNPNRATRELVQRGKYWYWVTTITSDILDKLIISNNPAEAAESFHTRLFLAQNNVDPEELKKKGTIRRYTRANVSFGVADYYYDYEF